MCVVSRKFDNPPPNRTTRAHLCTESNVAYLYKKFVLDEELQDDGPLRSYILNFPPHPPL